MEPLLSINDKQMFYKYLDKTTCYFEYGSGGSTYQASIRSNIVKIYSVESDLKWQHKLMKLITNPDITYIYNDMDVKGNWGTPGKKATDVQKINYSNHLQKISKEEQETIDLVFIDGRFRVACCLKCFDIINDDCLIAFDDFLSRKWYHIVLNYFDIVEQSNDNRMVILKKKEGASSPSTDLIIEYQLNYN
jgi:hypothetical protein